MISVYSVYSVVHLPALGSSHSLETHFDTIPVGARADPLSPTEVAGYLGCWSGGFRDTPRGHDP